MPDGPRRGPLLICPTSRTTCPSSAPSCRMAPSAGTPKFDAWRGWLTSRPRTPTESNGRRPRASGPSK
eukprot:7915996-Pyramimonas_sp.AAC.1